MTFKNIIILSFGSLLFNSCLASEIIPSSQLKQQLLTRYSTYSMETQRKDLKLQDNSDPLGITFLQNSSYFIKNSFCFPISKNEKFGFVLGTAHFIPLNHFSPSLIALFKTCKSLVCENNNKMPFTRERLLKNRLLNINASSEDCWINDLPQPVRNHLWQVISLIQTYTDWEGTNLWELTPAGALLYYYKVSQSIGMENDLERLIQGPRKGLETFEEALPHAKEILHTSLTPLELIVKLSDIAQHGSFTKSAMLDSELPASYAQGYPHLDDNDIKEIEDPQSGLCQRNRQWMNRWDEYFETLERPLFAVGCMHLCGEYSVLSLLENKGYTIYPQIMANDDRLANTSFLFG